MSTREELGRYYQELSRMSIEDRKAEKEARYKEMLAEGIPASAALRTLESEEAEAKTILREMAKEGRLAEKISEKERKFDEKEKYRKKFDKTELYEEIDDDYEPEVDAEKIEEKPEDEREEYLKVRGKLASGIRKAEEITKGIVGVGSRRPIKEALISGAAKVITSLKGKPKSPAEIAREKRYRAEEEHARRLAEAKAIGRRARIEPSLKDIGRGSLQAERYAEPTPDFFGTSKQFQMGTSSPIGKPIRTERLRPPSTSSIPFGGSRPPSTSIPGVGIKPPSTSLGLAPTKPPSVSLGRKKGTMEKMKPKKVKKPKPQSAEDVLGLRGYF